MELEYLNNLENLYLSNKKLSRIGVSVIDISTLESSLNVKLPKAYKEFLHIAGKRDGILGDWNRDFNDLDSTQNMQERHFRE
ncbi:SMI1/KNR4 family protein [Flavobacterium lindanitolerans]|nr:SMI1/KNR4 family protein [Flavobacterium lindanitolerans]